MHGGYSPAYCHPIFQHHHPLRRRFLTHDEKKEQRERHRARKIQWLARYQDAPEKELAGWLATTYDFGSLHPPVVEVPLASATVPFTSPIPSLRARLFPISGGKTGHARSCAFLALCDAGRRLRHYKAATGQLSGAEPSIPIGRGFFGVG
jgi:hypothetical protein